MASKSGFSMKQVLQQIASSVLGEGVQSIADIVKDKVHEIVADLQAKAEETLQKAVKTATLLIIMATGMVFVLVGFGKYLNETVPALANGLGYVVVGMMLVLMGLFATWSRK